VLRKIGFLLCSLLVVSLVPVALAQTAPSSDSGAGFPLNGAHSGGTFDQVQLANLALHIEIPLWSVPGRGLTLSSSFVLDSRGFRVRTTCTKGPDPICTDNIEPDLDANPFGHVVLSTATGLSYAFRSQSCTIPGNPGPTLISLL
jgi:hypothetical protein